jgi:hypothetical protein
MRDDGVSWDSLPIIHDDGSPVKAWEIREGKEVTLEYDPRRHAYRIVTKQEVKPAED